MGQGMCASCWALTTVGVFNDRLCISSGGVFNTQLSAADVLACSKLNYGCKGGSPSRLWSFYINLAQSLDPTMEAWDLARHVSLTRWSAQILQSTLTCKNQLLNVATSARNQFTPELMTKTSILWRVMHT